jgi:hypothetical protein
MRRTGLAHPSPPTCEHRPWAHATSTWDS